MSNTAWYDGNGKPLEPISDEDNRSYNYGIQSLMQQYGETAEQAHSRMLQDQRAWAKEWPRPMYKDLNTGNVFVPLFDENGERVFDSLTRSVYVLSHTEKVVQGPTYQAACTTIAQYWNSLQIKRTYTAESVYNYSPIGELWEIPGWYEDARLAGFIAEGDTRTDDEFKEALRKKYPSLAASI